MLTNANPALIEKAYLRDFFMERRRALCEESDRKDALDREIAARLLISPEYRGANKVLVYMARPYEIATSMIIFAALANHKEVGLPVCLENRRMVFRRIADLSDLRPGRFGILEPSEDCAELRSDSGTLVVCPALCCDMQGFRLGFGGGYYDRYLASFDGVKAALCYSDSVIPAIGRDDFDIPVDVIFTDNFTRKIQ